MHSFDRALVDSAAVEVVGRRRELELVTAALAASRHVLLEGPPGTGKSTLLRAIAERAGLELVFVEGNAELTPARLAGHFDPARVLSEGYAEDVFVDGPLVRALREGGWRPHLIFLDATDEALVRLVVPIGAGMTIEQADALAEKAARELIVDLDRHLPA